MGLIDRIWPFAQKDKGPVTKERGPTVRGSPPGGEVGVVLGWADEYLSMFGADTNPDESVQHFGLDQFEAFERKDAHVRNCYRIRRAALIRKPWEVTAASDSRKDKKVAEFVTWVLGNLKGTFVQDIKELMDALSKGYAVSELIWGRLSEGPWKGNWAVTELRSKPPQNFRFHRDKYGRVLKDGFRICLPGETAETPVPQDKFVIWTFDKQYEDPHGRGLGSTVSWCAWFKKSGLKFWLVFLEKFGCPTVKIQLPKDPTPADKKRAADIIRTIQTATGFWYPEGFEAALLEATKKGEGGFNDLLEWCDRQISEAILGQTLTTRSGDQGSGSYALGSIHKEIQDDLVTGDAEDLEGTLQEQLIRQIVDYNFPVDEYPAFHWIFPKSTAPVDGKVLDSLLKSGLEIPKKWAYDHFGIAEPDDEELKAGDILKAPAMAGPPGGGPELDQGEDGENGGGKGDDGGGASSPLVDAPSRIHTVLLSTQGPPAKGLIDIADFTETVGRDLDDLLSLAIQEVNPLVFQATTDYIESIRTSGVFESRDPQDVDDLKPDYKGLQDALYRTLIWARLEGYTDAQRILIAKGWKPDEVEFTERATDSLIVFLWESQVSPIDVYRFAGLEGDQVPAPEEALAFFRALQVVPADLFYASELGGRAFTISGATEQAARKVAFNHILEALDNGWGFEEFRDNLLADSEFVSAYLPPRLDKNTHLETVFRTNLMTAYNQGRKQFYQDGHVKKFIRYWQYNAILDGRVRPSHAVQHGVTLPAGHGYWAEWYPPNGYNCRCTVDPVTDFDKESLRYPPSKPIVVDGKPISMTPDKGFGQKIMPTPTGTAAKIQTIAKTPTLTKTQKTVAARMAKKIAKKMAKPKPPAPAAGALSLDDALKAIDAISDQSKTAADYHRLEKILARQLGCDPTDVDLGGFARPTSIKTPGADYGKNIWDIREVKRIARDYAQWVDEYGGEVSLKGGIGRCQGGFGNCGYGKVHYWEAWGEGPKMHSKIGLNGRIMTDSYRAQAITKTEMLKSTNVAAGTEIHEFTHAVQGARWFEVKMTSGGEYIASQSKFGDDMIKWTRDFRTKMQRKPHLAKYFSDYGLDLPIEVHTEVHAALRYPGGWIRRFGYGDFVDDLRYQSGGPEKMLTWLRGHTDYARRAAGKDLDVWLTPKKLTQTLKDAFLDNLGWNDDLVDAVADAYGTWLWETKWSRVYYGLMRRARLISGNETFVPKGMSRFSGSWRPASYKGAN